MERVAIITGAGGFIGSATAVRMAKDGIKVAVLDINEEACARTVKAVEAIGGTAKGYAFDVTRSEECDRVVSEVVRDFGRLDIMAHIAGGSSRDNRALLVDQTDDVIIGNLAVNLMGAIWMSRAAARVMIKQGQGGRIVCFSSTVGANGAMKNCEYAAAKAGVMGFVKALAKEVGYYGITVNAVAPGIVIRPDHPENLHTFFETNYMNHKCTNDDIAGVVNFVCGPEAGFMTGQTIFVDGGRGLGLKGTEYDLPKWAPKTREDEQ